MKRLFLSAFFALATFAAMQAQQLDYYLYNNSNQTWNFKMQDSGSSGAVYELNIAPGQSRSGTIANFSFNLEWAAENGLGCYTTTLETGPVFPEITIPVPPCVPPTSITYKIEPLAFGNFVLKMQFD